MQILLVAPISYLKLEDSTTYRLGPYLISNDASLLKPLLSSSVHVNYLGGHAIATLTKNCFAFFEGNHLELINDSAEFDVYDIAADLCGRLSTFVNALWLIKDNSISVTTNYVMDCKTGELAIINRNIFFSNSQGKYETVFFNEKELLPWADYIDFMITEISSTYPGHSVVAQTEQGVKTSFISAMNYAVYDYNRVERAKLFLQKANTESKLIIKITFFIAIYECLFTSKDDRNEVAHKDCERAARFIGTSQEERLTIFNLLKDAYSVRSKFVHGDVVTKQRTDLLLIIEPLTNLTRTLFHKLLEDNSIFTSYTKSEYDDYFKKLIFA